MAQAVELTVVVTSFNTRKFLKNCLDALVQSTRASGIRTEIIVVDNGSTDGSKQMLIDEYPKLFPDK
jgi:glycosyltransferase involved in cell wall biosynthesis